MCGIAGIINPSDVKAAQIVQMTNIIRHRGPDDEGYVLFTNEEALVAGGEDTATSSWEAESAYLPKKHIDTIDNKEIKVAFAHRRLSILDLSPHGHQPMCDTQERYWITFNGEIYNYLEIKEQLQGLGYHFHTNTDTEVVLVAYQEWGMACQDLFNGMWAFAIYDTREKSIFLSRDRYGIKPLYYWFSPNGDFYFGSEIKQFTTSPNWRAILNGPRAYDFLYYALTDHTDETLFQGVNHLLSGHCFFGKVENLFQGKVKGKLDAVKWYQPDIQPFKGSFEEAKDSFLEKFKDAVQLHLRADVPIGSALSGGLDSSSIVSYINILLKEQGKTNLQKTFSSCSEDERFDERVWMEEVVKETKVDGHYIYPQGKDVFSLTEKIVWHMDEPYQSQSAFLGYHVFQEAKKNNVVVLLNGQGADEYLSGYADFRILRHKKLLLKGKFQTLFQEYNSLQSFSKSFLNLLYHKLPDKFHFFLSMNNQKHQHLDAIVNWSTIIEKKTHPYQLNENPKKNHQDISAYQLFKDPLPRYLRWEDRNSMAHSVEARVPFLDYRLVELANSLPLDYLDAPLLSKRILVESMKGILPEKVRQRKDKKGFITPEQKWFMIDYKEEYIEMLRSNLPYAKGIINADKAEKLYMDIQNGHIPFDYTPWVLLQFCIWMKIFKVELQ